MRAALLAAALAALLVAGCGSTTPTPEETVSAAVSGVSQGDEQQVCSRLTAGAKEKLLATLADNPLGYPDIKAASCEEGISKLHAQLSKPIRDVLQDGEVDDARIDGDRAVVHVTGAGMDVELQKISGRWMIVDGFFRR